MPGRRASEATRRAQILKAASDVALRRGLDGLTVRAVAARAKLSHGLILFHFKRRDDLVGALLDDVLAGTLMLDGAAAALPASDAPDRLGVLMRREMDRLSQEPRRVGLFLEFWALGAW